MLGCHWWVTRVTRVTAKVTWVTQGFETDKLLGCSVYEELPVVAPLSDVSMLWSSNHVVPCCSTLPSGQAHDCRPYTCKAACWPRINNLNNR
jgi:hypothetical protein